MIKKKIEEKHRYFRNGNVVFIFTKKWHNNTEEKKAVVNCLFFCSLKKGVADAQEQSFNNIKESKATVKMYWPQKVRQLIYPKDLVLYCTGLSPFSFVLIRLLL